MRNSLGAVAAQGMKLTRNLPVVWFRCRGRKVVAIRHAEVVGGAGPNPGLSAAGQARAHELVHVFEATAPAKILVSNFVRTQQTAAPVAAAVGLTPVVLSATDIDGYVAAINALPLWSTVLAIGHSNTIPAIVGKLCGLSLPDIAADEFDRMYVALGAQHLQLRYGKTSP